MNDRPDAAELLAAVRLFLEGDLLPTLADARLKFQTLIAANVLAIAERELQSEEADLREECTLFANLLDRTPQTLAELRQAVRDANQKLCAAIRGGGYDDPERFAALASILRRRVERKLEIANPRYLANFRATSTSDEATNR